MWTIKRNVNNRLYLQDNLTGAKKIVPQLTDREIEIDRYQQLYDKAYTMCEYLNGKTVYHTRVVNGKKYIYKMRRKTSDATV